MPNMPKKPCARCGQPTDGTYCPDCQQSVLRQHNSNYKRDKHKGRFYKRARWEHERRAFIAENARRHSRYRPVCEICGRPIRYSREAHVDHIIPHNGDARLFWDWDNWQVLCSSCHGRKTREEEG